MFKPIFRYTIVLTFAFNACITLAADPDTFSFAINRQNLGEALLLLAEQADRQIFVRSSLLENQLAGPVSGDLSIPQALVLLLADTELTGEVTQGGRIKVSRNRGYLNSDIEPSVTFSAEPSLEEVMVKGLGYAWESSYQLKKNALRVKDVLSEVDMDKLPDGNVADSLQRLSGLQIERRNGDGTRFRVRGFDTNVTLYNGELFLTGMEYFQLGLNEQSYENSVETLPVELLRRIEVYKSFRASDIEGAIGGTIDLVSRNAFDVKDYLITADVKTDRGKFARKAKPEFFVGLGRNWNDTFAALFSLNFAKRTMHMDVADNYIARNPFGSRTLGLISEFNDQVNDIQFDYLAPVYTSLADIEQSRSQVGASLNLAWRPSAKFESQIEWFGIRSDLQQRNYEWLTGVGGADSANYTFNQDYAFPFLTGLDYKTGDEIFRTVGEVFDTQADNINLQTTFMPTKRWQLSTRLSYSSADFTQELGNADLVTIFNARFLPVWIGEEAFSPPGLPDVSSPTGWTKLYNICARCQDPAIIDDSFQYRLDSNTYTHLFDVRDSINLAEDTFGALSQANAADTNQTAASVRTDAKFFINESASDHITFGFRFDKRETSFTQSRYLTNLAQTKGAARPNQFDENLNITRDTDFSPARPGDATNVGVALPTFYDLCGNGGMFANQSCDIDGDSIDDNSPYGPWVYQINPTGKSDPLGNLEFYSFSLYGQDFGFDTPGYIPWRSYDQFPQDYTRLSDFFPSGSLASHTASFVEGETISRDVAAWIDRMAPFSPSKRFAIPRNSWAVEQETRAVYVEYNHTGDVVPIRFNFGLRYVETDLSIERSVIDSGLGISLTPDEWFVSGIGSGWRPELTENSYHDFLPAANFVWDINDTWKLRFSVAKNVARPSFSQLGRGDSPDYTLRVEFDEFGFPFGFQQATGMSTGNPDLKPVAVRQGDISLEYYGDQASYAQLVFFYKGMQGQIFENVQLVNVLDETDGGSSIVPVNRPVNVERTHARGFELTLQKTWKSGFGSSLNYSKSDLSSREQSFSMSDLGLPGVSEQTFNGSGFYENDRFRFLLTYAWRDEFLAPYDSITIARKEGQEDAIRLAHIFESYGQWDARLTYFHSDLLSVSLDLLNITQSEQKSYLEFQANSRSRTSWEPRALLGMQLNF